MLVVNIEPTNSTRVLGALRYRSLPLCSLYHKSQQAADLLFGPTMKRSQKREKANFKRNFLAKKTGNNSTNNCTYVTFSQGILEKLLISAFSSQFFSSVKKIQDVSTFSDVIIKWEKRQYE